MANRTETLAEEAIRDGVSHSGELSYDRIRELGEALISAVEEAEKLCEEWEVEEAYSDGYSAAERDLEGEWQDGYDEGYKEAREEFETEYDEEEIWQNGYEEGYTQGYIEGRREALEDI